MGFFDKMKKMVGKTGVELDYRWIENPFPFNDPMIKATLRIKADSAITVVGATGTFYAKREDDDGMEEEIILGEEECTDIANGDDYNKFPESIESGGVRTCAFFVDDMDLVESLKEWGVDSPESAKIKGVRFFFKGEVDVKETVGLFDPTLEQEITVK
ncbi:MULTISPECIES: hypothetical protein [unclassified Aureispira]|uniref:hypothetical protein n=1 Tax=unclassified Aureispira TaxID=2649989 RepID=UPI000696B892|nr:MULTISPECIES: hypothetical protein [unclassified Aureispira]WMX16250.1 hypothetical protein QP953_07715 [Aureispira sp. CCB-E]